MRLLLVTNAKLLPTQCRAWPGSTPAQTRTRSERGSLHCPCHASSAAFAAAYFSWGCQAGPMQQLVFFIWQKRGMLSVELGYYIADFVELDAVNQKTEGSPRDGCCFIPDDRVL